MANRQDRRRMARRIDQTLLAAMLASLGLATVLLCLLAVRRLDSDDSDQETAHTPALTRGETVTATPLSPTRTSTPTRTLLPTFTPSRTAAESPWPTPGLTLTATSTRTPASSATPTVTTSPTFTVTATSTRTTTLSFFLASTPTGAGTSTATATRPPTLTATLRARASLPFTPTATLTRTATPALTRTFTATDSHTSTPTIAATSAATFTATLPATASITALPVLSATPTADRTPSVAPLPSATPTPIRLLIVTPAEGATLVVGMVQVDGTGPAGAEIELIDSNGGRVLGRATCNNQGRWSVGIRLSAAGRVTLAAKLADNPAIHSPAVNFTVALEVSPQTGERLQPAPENERRAAFTVLIVLLLAAIGFTLIYAGRLIYRLPRQS